MASRVAPTTMQAILLVWCDDEWALNPLKFYTATATFTTITLNQSISFNGMAWDGTISPLTEAESYSAEINVLRFPARTGYGRRHSTSERTRTLENVESWPGRRYVDRAADRGREGQVEA